VVDIPDHIDFGMVHYVERDNAIVLIVLQVPLSLPPALPMTLTLTRRSSSRFPGGSTLSALSRVC
jgi:hypothetical protein